MKILIIDDSKDFRSLVRLYLAKTMGDAEPIEYAVEELGKPADDFPWSEYDILLLDYNLGGEEDGFDWLKQFKQKKGFPPTIILTAEGDEYIAVKAIKLGAADYINKVDITPKRLADVIKDTIEFASESITKQRQEISEVAHVVEKIHRKENDELPGQGIALGYKIVRKIGQGAMSKVYLAERENDNQSLVIKVLDIKNSPGHATIERFVQEAELISALDSPFVVKIFEHGLTDDYGFIAMEFFSRGDLKQRMEMNIPPELAATYMIHIAYGLSEIHNAGVIHRDLKPANIMFRGDDSLALADFGISKRVDAEVDLTTMGQIMGTPHYMSPEQGEGLSIDGRTDLYSAGVMLYELLMREKPFAAPTPAALIFKHINEEIPTLPEGLNRFQEIIDNLMAKNPDDRYSSANELIKALMPLE
jgi:FixJ family two-component response regulator/tRNA A-37 threonylcarbamoyl transferase component Bud32